MSRRHVLAQEAKKAREVIQHVKTPPIVFAKYESSSAAIKAVYPPIVVSQYNRSPVLGPLFPKEKL